MNAFIASDEIVSAIYCTSGYNITLTADKQRLLLAMKAFRPGDAYFWRWRQTCFALETNTLKTRIRTSATHAHTQLVTCTSDFQTELMSR